jgi:pimeloyl-ACP methyl ester carboxylesterase
MAAPIRHRTAATNGIRTHIAEAGEGPLVALAETGHHAVAPDRRGYGQTDKPEAIDQLLPALKHFVPDLRQTIMLPSCGHWTQQERVNEVNTAMLQFLKTVA